MNLNLIVQHLFGVTIHISVKSMLTEVAPHSPLH